MMRTAIDTVTSMVLHNNPPCLDAVEWIKAIEDNSPQQAWEACERGDWMIWSLQAIGYGDRTFWRKISLVLAESILEAGREPDGVIWEAIRVTKLWLEGKAIKSEVERVANQAGAWAAAYSALAAAWSSIPNATQLAAAWVASVTSVATQRAATYSTGTGTVITERVDQAKVIRELLPEWPG